MILIQKLDNGSWNRFHTLSSLPGPITGADSICYSSASNLTGDWLRGFVIEPLSFVKTCLLKFLEYEILPSRAVAHSSPSGSGAGREGGNGLN